MRAPTVESTSTSPMKSLLVDELRDLLHAEGQLIAALPKMAAAAHNPNLKKAFEAHLQQTKGHVDRLNKSFELLGEKGQPKPCKAMMGLVEEGKETIEDGQNRTDLASDLALIAAAQKVEHYEISSYGTARTLARHIGERDVATLLSHTLGEEEAADCLLTSLAMPLMQESSISPTAPGAKPASASKRKE